MFTSKNPPKNVIRTLADLLYHLWVCGDIKDLLAFRSNIIMPLPCSVSYSLIKILYLLQLAALLQCRNHALIDVETALEAAEGQTTEKVGRRQLVPVAMIHKRGPSKQVMKPLNKVKEVQLKVFHQGEGQCVSSDLPCLDPLRLRTE